MDEVISFQLVSNIENINIERFHMCTWEVGVYKPIIEFGIDINPNSLVNVDEFQFTLFTPWNIQSATDLFDEIKTDQNARFIFNESISDTKNVNSNPEFGVIHHFSNNTKLCILQSIVEIESKNLKINVDLKNYNELIQKDNIYIRFYIIPINKKISILKNGIAKSTIIYDTKINEKRNMPINLLKEVNKFHYPSIKTCYNFNIVPNNYEISFQDKNLKSVRNLEFNSFKTYFKKLIDEKKIKIDNKELLVIFNKNSQADSTYSFFTIYTKEHFGFKQTSIIIILNLICSFLFFLPSYRGKKYEASLGIINNLKKTPIELWLILVIITGAIFYIFNPKNIFKR